MSGAVTVLARPPGLRAAEPELGATENLGSRRRLGGGTSVSEGSDAVGSVKGVHAVAGTVEETISKLFSSTALALLLFISVAPVRPGFCGMVLLPAGVSYILVVIPLCSPSAGPFLVPEYNLANRTAAAHR